MSSGTSAGTATSSGRRSSRNFSSSPSAAAAPASEGAVEAEYPHVSVLLNEVLDVFRPVNLKVYVDGTMGAGGHASALLVAHPEMRTLVGIDVDPVAHAIAEGRLRAANAQGAELLLLRGNFSEVAELVRGVGAPPNGLCGAVDGILLDLGVSSMQIDTAERGFSFLRDGPLDMRMDPQAKLSAEDVLNTWSEAELGRVIREYGEEKLWRNVARRIVAAREEQPIRTTQQLVRVIGETQLRSKGGGRAREGGGGRGIHPATRTFQALRIVVNGELERLEKALPAALGCLAPGGRLAVISFHSLEDRAVKRAFSRAAGRPTPEDEALMHGKGTDKYEFLDALEQQRVANLVTRRPLVAGEGEVAANARSRSAKLRAVEKLALPAAGGV